MIEKEKVVTLTYDMYVGGNGEEKEELMERATKEHPLVYCHGEKMMLPKFEAALEGKNEGDTFDFRISHEDAYGEYDSDGVLVLKKELFYNGDGEFDSERVYVGNIVPMNTTDGQIVNAQIVEITETEVTIDLNHPLAGEDLHFMGTILAVRDADPKELEAIRHPHSCGGCHGNCGGDCKGEHDKEHCKGHCEGHCKH